MSERSTFDGEKFPGSPSPRSTTVVPFVTDSIIPMYPTVVPPNAISLFMSFDEKDLSIAQVSVRVDDTHVPLPLLDVPEDVDPVIGLMS